jgi:hypothetical protein
MNTNNIIKFLSNIGTKSTFLNIKNYKTNKGKTADYLVNFNSDYKTAVEKSVIDLFKFVPKTNEEKQAKEELMSSLREALDSDTMESVTFKGKAVKGLKKSKAGKLFITGFIMKQDMEPKTEKQKLYSMLPISKFRQFEISPAKMKEIVVSGKTLKVS